MRARDNEFVEQILRLADEHFSEDLGIDTLETSISEKWVEAESHARASGDPFNFERVRWAVRRILFQPDVWPGISPDRSATRRAALEKVLVLCKD